MLKCIFISVTQCSVNIIQSLLQNGWRCDNQNVAIIKKCENVLDCDKEFSNKPQLGLIFKSCCGGQTIL